MADESGQGRSVVVGEVEPRGRLTWPEDVGRLFDRAIMDLFSTWPWLHLKRR
jgi:hypothetical protein